MRNWYVITGGPSTGKTTLIEMLAKRGFRVEHESARAVIDEELAKGRTIQDIRSDEFAFQKKVYERKREREDELDPNKLIFFDRGMQDTYAYCKLYNFAMEEEMHKKMDSAEYKAAFLLEPLSYTQDYARTESAEEREQLFSLLKEAYERSGVPVEVVPPLVSKGKRLAYILEYLRQNEGISVR